jgi:hypothetical protein
MRETLTQEKRASWLQLCQVQTWGIQHTKKASSIHGMDVRLSMMFDVMCVYVCMYGTMLVRAM